MLIPNSTEGITDVSTLRFMVDHERMLLEAERHRTGKLIRIMFVACTVLLLLGSVLGWRAGQFNDLVSLAIPVMVAEGILLALLCLLCAISPEDHREAR